MLTKRITATLLRVSKQLAFVGRRYITSDASSEILAKYPQLAARLESLRTQRDTQTDVLDTKILNAMLATLDTYVQVPITSKFSDGDHIPQGWHVGFCLKDNFSSKEGNDNYFDPNTLGDDGQVRQWAPGPPFVQRMFAGGTYIYEGVPLTAGETVTMDTEVSNVELKHGRTGPLVFIETTHYWRTSNGRLALKELRNIVYKIPSNPPPPPSNSAEFQIPPPPSSSDMPHSPPHVRYAALFDRLSTQTYSFPRFEPPTNIPKPLSETMPTTVFSPVYTLSTATLFRFSALTFNSHRVHYDKEYVEHSLSIGPTNTKPAVLVHAPLTVLLIMDYIARQNRYPILRFEYRNTAPLYADQPFRIIFVPNSNGKTANLFVVRASDDAIAVDVQLKFDWMPTRSAKLLWEDRPDEQRFKIARRVPRGEFVPGEHIPSDTTKM